MSMEVILEIGVSGKQDYIRELSHSISSQVKKDIWYRDLES